MAIGGYTVLIWYNIVINNMALINFNSKTGKRLQKGESFTGADGITLTQGTEFRPSGSSRNTQSKIPIASTDIQTKTAPLPIKDMNPNLANQGISQAQQVSAKFQPMEGSFEAQKQDVNDNVLSILQKQIEGLSDVENNRVTSAESFRQAQNESGILQKQERSNQLQGQLNEVVSRGQANQLAVVGQGRGIPEAI